MTIREIEALLSTRRMSCLELAQDTFRAIRERERWNSFITMTEHSALAIARKLDESPAWGSLRGVPVAFKDLFCMRGVRTTAGSPIYRDFIPATDSVIVEDQLRRGAVPVGKTNLHELAFGITSRNPHFGHVANPLDETRIPGGSSGGSAAVVAAGLVPLAWGTDTGGSIRIPASYCGVVGIKPTYGRFSTKHVLPLSWSLDHVGPLATTAEDCAIALGLEVSPRPDWKGVRVGVPENFFFDRVDQQVASAVRLAIDRMADCGASVREIRVPDPAEAGAAQRMIQWAEFAAQFAKITDRRLYGDDVWALRAQSLEVSGHEYVNAQRLRTVYRNKWDAVWKHIDVLVTPTTPITAPERDLRTVLINGVEEDVRIASTRLVRSFNFLGEPAMSIPCGRDRNGMPIGLQLIARPNSDELLLGLAGF